MTQPAVEKLLRRHMDKRTLAVILGTKDRELNEHLPPEVAERFRYVVLSEMRRFLELTLDVIHVLDDQSCTLDEVFLDELSPETVTATRG